MPRNERMASRPDPSEPPSLVRILGSAACGLAVFGLAGGLVLAGVGAPAGPLVGVMATYLLGFLGSGLLVAVVIEWIFERRRRKEGPWP